MHWSKAARATCLFTWVLMGVAGGCSQRKADDGRSNTGSVALGLRLSPEVNVDRVDYQISGNGIVPLTGAIAVTDRGATASVLISGIPAGTGYLVELRATSSNGITTCMGSALFDVQAGGTTAVTVIMQCRALSNTGSVVVGGTLNNCPALTSYSVGPLATSIGGTIAVRAAAADLDAADVVTIGWSATAGSFHNAASATTTYTCSVPGMHALQVRASDGKCDAVASVDVTCTFTECGDAMVNPGEQCDPPNGITCSASCQLIPICGNGVLEAGEQCDPPNGTTCGSNCRAVDDGGFCGNGIVQPGETCDPPIAGICSPICQVVCGNNLLQPPEQCDPPNGNTCNFDCTAIDVICGNGLVQPTEECDPPNGSTCGSNCRTISGAG